MTTLDSPPRGLFRRHATPGAGVLLALLAGSACTEPTSGSFVPEARTVASAPGMVGTPAAATIAEPTEIIGGHAATSTELLGMVRVRATIPGEGPSTCSGMVIGADTVLTAAHCVCPANYVLDNLDDCARTATVEFRPRPDGATEVQMTGTVIANPQYDPSWIEGLFDDDLAVIKLSGVAPPHAVPYAIAQTFPTPGLLVTVAGYGHSNADCDNGTGTLFARNTTITGLEEGYHPVESMYFAPQVTCKGDSGGAVLDVANTKLYGVHSTYWLSASELEVVSNATSTTQHHNWIKSKMCLSSPTNTCDGWGAPCNCSATNGVLWRQTTGATRLWQMQGGVVTTVAMPGDRTADWKVAGTGDFNGDGNGDIAWRRDNGQFEIWRLTAGGTRIAPTFTSSWPGTSWTVQGVGDFDGDGGDDVLWRDTSGLAAIWFHGFETGAAFLGYNNTPAAVSNAWQIRGVADFNGDGRADILWGNASELKFSVWLMNGGTRTGEITGIAPSATATIAGVGDFEGDLRADILWRNGSGTLAIDFDAATVTRRSPSFQNAGGAVPSSWSILAVADFDRDGRSDILWRDTSGQVVVWIMEGARFVVDRASWSVDSSWSVAGTVHAKN